MTAPFFAANRPLSRRTFLRGAGVALSLPMLDAMVPAFARGAAAAPPIPRRMVAIQTDLGILPQFFWPEGTGHDYKASPYLEVLNAFRKEMTVFSGVSHPGVDGGHAATQCFLTAAPHPASAAFKNSVSLDQVAAERLGAATRFPMLATKVGNDYNTSLSYTRGGVMIPSEKSPSALYRKMFVQGTAKQVRARVDDLRIGRSTLDFVNDGAKDLQKDLGPKDRDRLDQYFTSVRDLENQLSKAQEWEKQPKPKPPSPEPKDAEKGQIITASRLMFDTIRLALETDSTRLVTIYLHTLGIATDIPGVEHETHTMTHHGNRPDTLAELRTLESAQFKALAGLLAGLKGTAEGGETLLDRTMVLYGTPMGSANAHSNNNLPVLLAGGGFRHAGLLAFDTKKNYPLSNLFVSMLQRLGMEVDKFASSTGTMRGLELA